MKASAIALPGPAMLARSSLTSDSTGPWRVVRIVSFTSAPPLTRIVSSRVSNGFGPSGVRYCAGLDGSIVSTNRSCVSVLAVVTPQAIWSFWPSSTIGAPGTVAPLTQPSGVTIRARYQRIGAPRPRCGSLARIGLPVTVREPETTHSFDAPRFKPGQRADRCRRRRRSSPAAPRLACCALSVGCVVIGSPGFRPGKNQDTLSGPSFCAIWARNASCSRFCASSSAISLNQTSESAGFHGSGASPEQQELGRQGVLVAVEEGVDAVGVGLKPLLRLGRERGEARLRLAIEPQRSDELVDLEEVGAESLGGAPLADPPVDLHLEEPLAGVQIAERAGRVVHVGGENMRHAVAVAPDMDVSREAGQLLGPRRGRHGPPEQPSDDDRRRR